VAPNLGGLEYSLLIILSKLVLTAIFSSSLWVKKLRQPILSPYNPKFLEKD